MKIDNNYKLYALNYSPCFKRNWQEHISWGAQYMKHTSKVNFKLFTFPDAQKVFVEIANKANESFGNIKERIIQILATQGERFKIDELTPKDQKTKIYPMDYKGDGIYEAKNIKTSENAQYRFIVVKNNGEISLVKDPYAKKQSNINGWSEIYDSDNYKWQATDWLEGKDARRIVRKPNEALRGLENLIIEEINIPTLSKEGSFQKAKEHIDKIAQKGLATAVEIMPVENCYSLQWGYDGVDKFAINEKLGSAVQLKELIDYAHLRGLNVIMDMVPNHIGPDGNYLPQTGPYIKRGGCFGDIPNYEGKHNRYVRDWMANAALWWANEFKVDGLRLDMTKGCESDFFLQQLVCEMNEHNPDVFIIAEDGRDNRAAVTNYKQHKISHEDELSIIDKNIDNIVNHRECDYPTSFGFDSEWDFPLMHELKTSIIEPSKMNLSSIDYRIQNSKHRVKFVMSHDEIGNLDGTRMVPKIITSILSIFDRIDGNDLARRGQKAAHIGQMLSELCLSNDIELLTKEKLESELHKMGLNNTSGIIKETIKEAFNIAIAKQRLTFATIMTLPGPKMYFQADDNLDLSYFKFFREFSNEKEQRTRSSNLVNNIIKEKGYDTLEKTARADSIIGRNGLSPDNNFYMKGFNKFTSHLSQVLKTYPVFSKGDIIDTFVDSKNKIHIHQLRYKDDEVMVIKNFGTNFFDDYSYPYSKFPEGTWKEIFSSDYTEFGGLNYNNSDRSEITKVNQNLKIAPNSVIILKKM